MKILPYSSISFDCLKNALLINEHGAEFLINGFDFDLQSHEILVRISSAENLADCGSVPFNSLSTWSIQINSH